MKKKFFIGFLIILFSILIPSVFILNNKSNAESRNDGVIYFDKTLLLESYPGEGNVTYIAKSSNTDITEEISGTMIATDDNNTLKTDKDIPTTYDYIQFYYTSTDSTEENPKEYTSGLLTIDNSIAEPCFYSYAFLELQQIMAEQIEYKNYYLNPSDLTVRNCKNGNNSRDICNRRRNNRTTIYIKYWFGSTSSNNEF